MKDILFLVHFEELKEEKGNSRFSYLVQLLHEQKNNVEIITSSFSHTNKKQRVKEMSNYVKKDEVYTLISEPSYNKNVSLKRIYSHWIMSKNLKKYLNLRCKPDVIYCAIPSLNTAKVMIKYAKRNNIPIIIDIQDLWPEAFKMVFNIPILADMIFKPMQRIAEYIYKNADEIVAVSQTYLERALIDHPKLDEGLSIFLGTELKYFDRCLEESKIVKPENEFWVTYIGTLGHSYNLPLIMDALEVVKRKNYQNIRFMVVGDGPLKEEFEKYANKLNILVRFTGRLEYREMIGYLKLSDVAVNPIRKSAAGSIINKVGDYAAAGIPVINTQECKEYRDLIEKYDAGINCDNGDIQQVANAIIELYENREMRIRIGKNNRRLAEEKFDREKTYKEIRNIINKHINDSEELN